MFIKNIWYVIAWGHEVTHEQPIARIVACEPIALWRSSDGQIQAMENRCPHRHAPLAMGRVEGDELRCMYHGLKFSAAGKCVHVPGSDRLPPNSDVRVFPVVEKDGWIWVWPGNPDLADTNQIPDAWGLQHESMATKTGAMDYAADYQLVNDNLTDLSHLDYVHENTLSKVTGSRLSDELPKITRLENGLRIQRWQPAAPVSPESDELFETWISYDYLLPGLFITKGALYPSGTAEALNHGEPETESPFIRLEQQAVTPTIEGHCRYLFASGAPVVSDGNGFVDTESIFTIIMAAFAEDKAMIEGQQVIWNLTADDTPRAFIPQDNAAAIFRRMIKERLRLEQE